MFKKIVVKFTSVELPNHKSLVACMHALAQLYRALEARRGTRTYVQREKLGSCRGPHLVCMWLVLVLELDVGFGLAHNTRLEITISHI